VDIKLEVLSATCSNAISSEAYLVRKNEEFIIEGFITAPNPCYRLEQSSEIRENTLIINLRLIRRPDLCIQCLAKISFRISIRDLSEEVKNIIILYQNKKILRYSL